eukprot:scaffold77778_cov54-Cyclotella_meneghiniana.AAC.6
MDDTQLEPLPYNIPPSPPRASFVKNLQLSSYLFPSNRLSRSNSTSFGSEKKRRKTEQPAAYGTSPSTQMTVVADNKSNNKKVTFYRKVVSIPASHTPTEEERRQIWYSKDDYDAFKFNSAQEAGVKLFDYFPPAKCVDSNELTTTYEHKFVMIGNYDKDEENNSSSLPSDATINGALKPTDRARGSLDATTSYHVPIKCAKEYNDKIDNEGYKVCQRGLGYHFSCHRKRNRTWTRAMVLTWQKTLRTQEQATIRQCPLRLSQKCDVKLSDKAQRLLAIVSAKCSKSSRKAALWRGKMDEKVLSIDPRKLDSKKRVATEYEQQAQKRQRFENRNDTTAYKYLAGVLMAEV